MAETRSHAAALAVAAAAAAGGGTPATAGGGEGGSVVVEREPALTEDEFLPVIANLLRTRASKHGAMLRLSFHVFARKRKRGVTLRDLQRGIRIVDRGSVEEKVRFVFQMYDADNSGEMDIEEVSRILSTTGDLWDAIVFTEQVMSSMDSDGDKSIQFPEFLEACKRSPLLFEPFANGFPISIVGSDVVLSEARQRYNFSWDNIKLLWVRMTTTRVGPQSDSVDSNTFRSVMNHFFSQGKLDAQLMERLFTFFNTNHDGELTFSEFIRGMSVVFRAGPREQAKFYFFLFDLDGGGTIDRSELYRTLSSKHQTSSVVAINESSRMLALDGLEAEVQAALDHMDEDGSGEIERDEWLDGLDRHPDLLLYFESVLFGAPSTPPNSS